MQKVSKCLILDKQATNGSQYRYRYLVKADDESGWANSECNYDIGETATLFLTVSRSRKWFAVVQ